GLLGLALLSSLEAWSTSTPMRTAAPTTMAVAVRGLFHQFVAPRLRPWSRVSGLGAAFSFRRPTLTWRVSPGARRTELFTTYRPRSDWAATSYVAGGSIEPEKEPSPAVAVEACMTPVFGSPTCTRTPA